MIVIDTNQLSWLNVPSGAAFAILRQVAQQHQHTIAIPEMVLAETLAHYQHDVEQYIAAIERGRRGLLSRGVDIKPKLPDVNRMVELRRTEFHDYVKVLQPTEGSAWEALQREAHRRRPAATDWDPKKSGSGARDALIWLTVLHTAQQPGSEPILLVTADADFGRDQRLHPELREELLDAGLSVDHVRLCPSVTEALTLLADKADYPANLELVLKSGQTTHTVNAALELNALPQLHWLYRDQLLGPDNMTMNIFLADDLEPARDGRTMAYQIGGETWVSAERLWRGTYWLTLNQADSRYGQPAFDMPFEVNVTVLIAPESAVERVQVIDCGMPRFTRDWLIPSNRRMG